MNTNKLSVIIAYRNEGKELSRTIEDIRRTVGNSVDVIVIDDASDDNYNFMPLFEEHNITYIRNKQRLGCAPSRDIGINISTTPYIFIIDGHMKFYDTSWHKIIVDVLEQDNKGIYCCKCKPIDYESGEDMQCSMGCGAYINIANDDARNVLDIEWINPAHIPSDKVIVDIPCILGASYAASKEYWNLLKGFDGLTFYSCDEQYISIKAWLEGSGCRLITNVVIGHLFRTKTPYEIKQTEFFHNKLLILHTLFPEKLSKEITHSLRSMNLTEYMKAAHLLDTNKVRDLKMYYQQTFKFDFNFFLKINEQFRNL